MSALREYLESWGKLRQHMKMPDGPSIDGFLLEHGRSYDFGPEAFAGKRMRKQQCFRNATIMASMNPDLHYVEGYVDIGIPIQHAWLVGPDGRVIDPTLRKSAMVREYFGVAFDRQYLNRSVCANGYYGLLGDFAFKTLPDLLAGKADFKPSQERRAA